MTKPYTIYTTHTAGDRLYAEEIRSLSAAKATARAAYDETHPMVVSIVDSEGRRIDASQPHGRGLLWMSL